MNEQRLQKIQARLEVIFQPQLCKLTDESALHAGHAGAASGGGHYRLLLVAENFQGKSRLIRQRLVYDCLRDMIPSDIHAIAMVTLTPAEYPPNQIQSK